MGYDTLKNGIVGLLKGLGFQESEYVSIENCPTSEYGKTFIIKPASGENDEDTSETLSSLIYDIQKWVIEFPFEKSSESQIVQRDDMHRKRDQIVKTIDNPSNWQSYARIQKYLNWKVDEQSSYYILTVEIKLIDTVNY